MLTPPKKEQFFMINVCIVLNMISNISCMPYTIAIIVLSDNVLNFIQLEMIMFYVIEI